ncbi:MAG: radical SAM protein [Rikenellaceae bacterium]|nr:radical SAM protein [Rikenellaceae bacterium]
MGTSLFGSVIFGPVKSRRLGISLGINLLPTDNKLCSFNCIYCECGWAKSGTKSRFTPRDTVKEVLENKLMEMRSEGVLPDVITFAGNGEPTIHPDFAGVIDDTVEIRDRLAPSAKIAVLSNATMIGNETVRNALNKVDRNILKLDSAFENTVRLIDDPSGGYSLRDTVENMKKFHGRLIIQTMFLRGEYKGERVDNTSEEEVSAWLGLLREIGPEQVMIYTIDRETPAKNLHKVSIEELNLIAEKVRETGIECSVSG